MANVRNHFERQHIANLAAYVRMIDEIFRQATQEAASIGAMVQNIGFDESDLFSFEKYPYTKARIDRLMSGLAGGVQTTIVNGINAEWTLANNKNSELARRVFGDSIGRLTQAQYRRYFSTNDAAREAFLARKEQGLNLSERVWNYANGFKSDMELGLDVGIRNGVPADEMSRELRQYLRHPDKLFRRVRDEHGDLVLSKRAQDFHPGQGVYRSSYMNARRLTATETNIAYRTADYERAQQLDFIVGIEVKLSNNHNCKGVPAGMFYDICDELQGRYPKDFKFTGWHPFCRCHVETILKTDEELMAENRAILNGEEPSQESVNRVADVPKNFKEWIADNADRIKRARSIPYFMRDNGVVKNGIFTLKEFAKPVHIPTVLELAAARHAARTPERISEIKQMWSERNERIKSSIYTKEYVSRAVKDGVEEFKLSEILGKQYDEDKGLIIDFFGKNLDWEGAKVMSIPTAKLYSVQDSVFPSIVEQYLRKQTVSKELIQVVELDGKYYVYDGNHRTAAAIIRGDKKIKAEVLKLSQKQYNELLNISIEKPDEFGEIIAGLREFDIKQNRNLTKVHSSATLDEIQMEYAVADSQFYKNSSAQYFDLLGLKAKIDELGRKFNFDSSDATLELFKNGNWSFTIRSNVNEYSKSRGGAMIPSFEITRTFRILPDGGIECHHDYFALADRLQGKGISKELFNELYKSYKRMGCKYVTVEANIDVGGYTWAKYGFWAENKYEAMRIFSHSSTPESIKAEKIIKEWYSKNKVNDNAPFPMKLIADQPWGKNALKGTDWYGFIDLTDSNMVKYFEKYLGI